MDLKEIGINTRNWVDSTQDRNYLRAPVNAAELSCSLECKFAGFADGFGVLFLYVINIDIDSTGGCLVSTRLFSCSQRKL